MKLSSVESVQQQVELVQSVRFRRWVLLA